MRSSKSPEFLKFSKQNKKTKRNLIGKKKTDLKRKIPRIQINVYWVTNYQAIS